MQLFIILACYFKLVSFVDHVITRHGVKRKSEFEWYMRLCALLLKGGSYQMNGAGWGLRIELMAVVPGTVELRY